MTFGKNMTFLIVDDQQTMRSLIKGCLRQLDYSKFHDAENVSQALDLLSKHEIDFVILDWNMPKTPGIELLKAIRSSSRWKSIPVLMVTSEAEQDKIMEAIKAKVSGYIIKPVKADVLAEKINTAIGI
ncbi:MAG: response regulator [Proteobacteria bacterium]|nr:response regulator [Pseudomonadota bacterium]